MSRNAFWKFQVRGMETNGRSLALIVRNARGNPVTLQPRSAKGWDIKHAVDLNTYAFLFKYKDPKGNDVPAKDILDFVYDMTVDGSYKPIAPAKYAGRSAALYREGEDKISSIFQFVNAIFVEMLTGKSTNTFEELLAAMATALDEAKRLGRGIIPVPEASNINTSALTATQQKELGTLMDTFSVQGSKFFATSPALHGDSRIGSYRNAEAAMLAFLRLKAMPMTDILEQEVEIKLLQPDHHCEFQTSKLLAGDLSRDTQRVVMLVGAGMLTVNQGLQELGYEPSADPKADELGTPAATGGANLMPSDDLPDDEPSGEQDG